MAITLPANNKPLLLATAFFRGSPRGDDQKRTDTWSKHTDVETTRGSYSYIRLFVCEFGGNGCLIAGFSDNHIKANKQHGKGNGLFQKLRIQ